MSNDTEQKKKDSTKPLASIIQSLNEASAHAQQNLKEDGSTQSAQRLQETIAEAREKVKAQQAQIAKNKKQTKKTKQKTESNQNEKPTS